MFAAPTFNFNISELNKAYRGKREYVSYYHSIIFAFKGQKILGMSQDQHSPAPREIHPAGEAAGRGERHRERQRERHTEKEERQEEESWSWGREQRGEQSHFQLARETTRA